MLTAPGPAKLLPKSVASPELLAHVVATKFLDAVPLNRQVAQLERYGIELTAQTLSNWMVRLGTECIVPLRNLMIEQALQAPLTYMDETTLQVLESEKSPTSEHYPPENEQSLLSCGISRHGSKVGNKLRLSDDQ